MKQLILTAVLSTLIGFLVFFAAITVTFLPGVAALYPASAVEATAGAWFGLIGAMASYIGLIVAGSVGGWFPIPNGLVLSISDFILAIVPAIAVRWLGLDPTIPNWKHAVGFVVASMIGSFVGSLWYNLLNQHVFKVIAGEATFWIAVAGWNIGNFIIIVIIGLPLMKYGTRAIMALDLFNRKML
jgi:hypothetical protein